MDAKSLLRAKKAEAKIQHPYASYNAAGQLRCSICAIPVKQWDAHLLTKQHRTSAARERALEIKAKEAKEAKEAKGKRAAVEDVSSSSGPSKRKRVDNQDGQESDDDAAGQLPAGFFSAGNPASTSSNAKIKDSESIPEEEAEPPAPTGDAELDDFLASLSGPTEETTVTSTISTGAAKPAKPGSSYRSKGQLGVASYEAAPVRLVQEEQAEVAPEEPEETEAERRARIAREEKEEIMDRLEEEQRAQEDADDRVAQLKARMEMIKKRREGKPKAAKTATA